MGKVCRVLGNESSWEQTVPGTKVSGNERSMERMVLRTKVPSWERMFQGTNSLQNECSWYRLSHHLRRSGHILSAPQHSWLFFSIFCTNQNIWNIQGSSTVTATNRSRVPKNIQYLTAPLFDSLSLIRGWKLWHYITKSYAQMQITSKKKTQLWAYNNNGAL